MAEHSTTELLKDWLNGWLIAIACFTVGIAGASPLRRCPWSMFVGFVLPVLVPFIGISLLIGRG